MDFSKLGFRVKNSHSLKSRLEKSLNFKGAAFVLCHADSLSSSWFYDCLRFCKPEILKVKK